MVKNIFLLATVAVLVMSCDNKQAQKTEELKDSTIALADTLASKTDSLLDSHTSQTSLDVEGSYKATLPCADCEGIETVLKLSKDNTYELSSKYLGKGDGKPSESKGTYSWSKEGDKIILDEEDGKIQFKVGENQLIRLDLEGKPITGDFASHYILTKEK